VSSLSPAQLICMEFPPAAERFCEIVVEAGLLSRLGECLRGYLSAKTRLLLVTDACVAKLYLDSALESLVATGFEVYPYVVPGGEGSKSLAQAQGVYEAAIQAGLGRQDAMLALGGGVVGDLTGFCASTYHRGIPVIQIPTTLLAQVDSAIGGKTAVNAGEIKNGVGTFHQPRAVLVDPQVLMSLSERERAAGMGEVLKYGLIERSCLGAGTAESLQSLNSSPENSLWELLKCRIDAQGLTVATDPELLRRCAALKASVVCRDEFETLGLRYFLNLGHTFGHAYESLSQYDFLHGEAVAIGLLKAVQLAVRLGQAHASLETDLRRMLTHLGLSPSLSQAQHYAPELLLAKMRQDKKNHHGRIRLILPTAITGFVETRDDIDDDLLLEILAYKESA
jgi:3-dehydroquinate synthase